MGLQRSNLREQASAILRARIISGEMEPGVVYSASGMAAGLGVSMTPVREAFLDLAKDGLVVAVPNKGFRIVEPTDQEVEEILALRLLLEVPPLVDVIARADDEQLARLDKHVEDGIAGATSGDVAGFLIADGQFHLALIDLAGNRRLTDLVRAMRDQTRLAGATALARFGQLDRAAMEHRDVLNAVKARDETRAQALMRAHLRQASDRETGAGRKDR